MRILKDLRGEIEGRDVLVVEDIVDTGHTLARVLAFLQDPPARPGWRPARCSTSPRAARWTCARNGPASRSPTEFVVGYGIDYAQRNRNLPHIGAVRFTG